MNDMALMTTGQIALDTWGTAQGGHRLPPRARPRLHPRTTVVALHAALEAACGAALGLAVLRMAAHLSGARALTAAESAAVLATLVATFVCAMLQGMRMGERTQLHRMLLIVAAGSIAGAGAGWLLLRAWGQPPAPQTALFWTSALLVTFAAGRLGLRWLLCRTSAPANLRWRVALIGHGPAMNTLRTTLAATPAGIAVVEAGAPDLVRARWHSLDRLCAGLQVDALVLESQAASRQLGGLDRLPIDLDVYCLDHTSPDRTIPHAHPLAGLPITRLQGPALSQNQLIAKLAFDRAASFLVLLFITPVLLAIAAAIKLDSPGPVLFRQQRVGYGGGIFQVLKFRTMFHHRSDHHAARQTARDDDRVTRVGRVLRRLSLDELPQLFNVLLGDMSLVGPRPHALQTSIDGRRIHELVECYAQRHAMPPGITGWAQVNGARGALVSHAELERRVALDLNYIKRWSLWLDIKILALTVRRELFSSTAF